MVIFTHPPAVGPLARQSTCGQKRKIMAAGQMYLPFSDAIWPEPLAA
jgi:hypothetical protein